MRVIFRFLPAILPVSFLLSHAPALAQGQWTHFRGNRLDGIALQGTYPLNWNDSSNISWYAAVHGRGWSSPVVYDNQVWVTTASADGKSMSAVCIDLSSGAPVFDSEVFNPEKVYRKHAINTYATPTSAIEEGFVYVHFGRYGTACLDTRTGEKVWERTDLYCEDVQGPGSSLLLHGDKLFVHMEGTDVQEIFALDKKTGQTVWKAERNRALYDALDDIGKKAYVTPIVIIVRGRELLISNGSAVCNAYDVETGEEVWYIVQGEDSTISMPVEYNGRVYFYTSFVSAPGGGKYCELWCVDPSGTGDLSENIIWRMQFPILQLLTPVIHDDLLFTVDTESVLYCIRAETGSVVWKEQLNGKYNSSPVWANGNIYLSNTRGETLVFQAAGKFKILAGNTLPGEIWATPAFVDGSILIRTSGGVVCVR